GDLDGVFANLAACTPELRESLAAHEEQVRRNARATPLVRDVPVDVDLTELRMGGWDADEVHKLFNFLEFRTLWDRLLEAVGPEGSLAAGGEGAADGGRTAAIEVTVEPGAAADVVALCETGSAVAMEAAWRGEPGRSRLHGIAIATTGDAALWLDETQLADPAVRDALRRLTAEVSVHAHRAK